MSTGEKEPAPTIRAELGRRRLTAGRLAAAANMSQPRLQRRLNDPDSLQLGEVSRIATALSVSPSDILAGWLAEQSRRSDAEVAS